MAEKNGMEMLSALMGEQGQDALKMMQRVQRLQRLMGPAATPAASPVEKKEEVELFARNRKENMITAAIPFLNREYQRDLYIVVRLMEMQRVLGGGLLETRERQEEPPHLRQRKMLRAIQKYLPTEEQNQMQTILKFMDMKEIMEREGLK